MNNQSLITDRLELRLLTQEVYDHVFNNLNEEEQKNFLGLHGDEQLRIERWKYQNGLSTHNRKFAYFQILDKETKEVIGWCGFHTWYIDHSRAELGYSLIREKHKRKGIMSEALGAIIPYGFQEMKLHRIEAFTAQYNKASIGLLKKFGFTKEGVMRQHYFVNGKPEDSVVFALLKD